jgi:hypothetical protein
VYERVSPEFSLKQSTGKYSFISNSVMAIQRACGCEFGNSSQRQVAEQKKIHVWMSLATAANDRSRTEENSCVDEFGNSS